MQWKTAWHGWKHVAGSPQTKESGSQFPTSRRFHGRLLSQARGINALAGQIESIPGGEYQMESDSIISAIDAEIAKLQQARSLLANGGKPNPVTTRKATKKLSVKQPKKRVMSSEVRARIAEAQRKRWAAVKKTTKEAAKKAAPAKAKKSAPKKAVKRTVSPEARRRMADAQRKRWDG